MPNLAWQLRRARIESPNKIAIIDRDERKYTYEDLDILSNRVGNFLQEEFGVGSGDFVHGIMPTSISPVAFMFGVMKAGAAFSLENFTLKRNVIRGNIERTEANAVIVDEAVFDDCDHLADTLESDTEIHRFDSEAGGSLTSDVEPYSNNLEITSRKRGDLACINYTSGTSGPPKAVKFTHGTLGASIEGTKDPFLSLRYDDRNLMFMPMYHSGGISSILYATSVQSITILVGGWDVDTVIDRIEEYNPNWFHYIVPTMLRDLFSHDRWENADLDGIKMQVAGSPGPSEMFHSIFDKLREKGARPTVCYGMTEAMPMVVLIAPFTGDKDLEAPPDSVGKPAEPLVEVKLVDVRTNEEITEPGTEGEICWRGDNLTPGYYNDPERTAEALDEEGWFHTDDMGYFDGEGYFYITGRVDEMIISGGEKLSLSELDDKLLDHETVEDAGTVGVDHERFGKVPAAFVVPSDQSVTEDDLMDELNEYMLDELARWKRPRLYILADEIPRTASKQTKITPQLEERLTGITLNEEDRVVTLSQLQKKKT